MGFMTSSELKIYLLAVGAAAVVALTITLIVMLPGYLDYRKQNRQNHQDTSAGSIPFDYEDFLVPEAYSKLISSRLYSYYDYKNKWGDEEVAEYWNDPEKMVLEYLDRKNSSAIEDILDKYE